jgi:single-stranded-DNA-specific exonuclease
MKKIVIRDVPDNIAPLHKHPLLHRIYAARGITSANELDCDLKHLLPYNSLKDIAQATTCLAAAIQENNHVLIVGDFDTDGATSTALAILTLKAFGLKNVSYLIPNRFEYGYGLTPEIVAVAATKKPHLIMTVDNGIASPDGVRAANELGIKVLITDHHLPGNEIPQAQAIVNPNQQGDEFPSKSLAGVGVVFYLMLAVRANLRDTGWFTSQNIVEPNMAHFLDLVALGTVADAVTLDRNNRILVTQGVNRIKSGNCRLGIKALLAITKRNYEKASTYDLGFVIAPRINAAGRLDDMSLGVECLLSDDPVKTRSIAKELNGMNDERRSIEDDMQHQASRLVANLQLEQNLPPGLCIFEESWHQGVLGILAGRLKDKLHRPVIAFTAINDNEIKGSARSVDNVHIKNVLDNIAAKNPGLISKFGGHAMAAGLTLKRENYETFAQAFATEVEKHLTLEDLHGIIHTDGELPAEYFHLSTAELLQAAGPWGAGFSEPIFFGEFALTGQSLVGKKHLKLTLRHLNTSQEVGAICFNINPGVWPNPRYAKAKVIYRLNINDYNSQRNLQLIINEIISYE